MKPNPSSHMVRTRLTYAGSCTSSSSSPASPHGTCSAAAPTAGRHVPEQPRMATSPRTRTRRGWGPSHRAGTADRSNHPTLIAVLWHVRAGRETPGALHPGRLPRGKMQGCCTCWVAKPFRGLDMILLTDYVGTGGSPPYRVEGAFDCSPTRRSNPSRPVGDWLIFRPVSPCSQAMVRSPKNVPVPFR